MAADSNVSELNAPLLSKRTRAAKRALGTAGRRRRPVARLALAGIVVLFAAAGLRIILVDTPDGGRPLAEVAVNSTRNANPVVGGMANGSIISIGPQIPLDHVAAALASGETADGAADPETAARLEAFGMLPDLVEDTEFGPIPRRSGSGTTPFAAYARPSVSAAAVRGKPRIAIIVTGLGINLSGTLEAIGRLPDTVTLAFAPYGKDFGRTVGGARAEGHEVFLEVPLEPFDYPDNDPGPDTLLTGQAPRDNMQKLYRVMGKFGGYVGLINNMGARFTASAADFGPVMEELAMRGLGYLDDGSSNRSLAPQLAAANRVPFRRADAMLDGNPTRASILGRLTELEDLARQNGSAMGLVAALPVSVETVAEWAAGLEERGVTIVPASALMKAE
jgi:polysaccharide deacetylase 2 family uncharacterized protein YibQ